MTDIPKLQRLKPREKKTPLDFSQLTAADPTGNSRQFADIIEAEKQKVPAGSGLSEVRSVPVANDARGKSAGAAQPARSARVMVYMEDQTRRHFNVVTKMNGTTMTEVLHDCILKYLAEHPLKL
jgi:hypothetical protein